MCELLGCRGILDPEIVMMMAEPCSCSRVVFLASFRRCSFPANTDGSPKTIGNLTTFAGRLCSHRSDEQISEQVSKWDLKIVVATKKQ